MNKRLYMPDGVRVMAIGLIMWFHIWQQSWLTPAINLGALSIDLSPAVRTGYMLVDIMLMLSGYLLFMPIARGAHLDTAQFYKKRLIRILPCYLLSVFVMLFCFALPNGEYAARADMWKDLITHLTFTHTFFTDTYVSTRLNVVLWTLAIEMLLARAFKARPVASYLAMTAAALAFRKFVAAGRSDIDLFLNQLPGMLDVYAHGMMAALITAETERHEQGKYSRIFYTAVLMFAFFQLWLLMKSQYAMSFPMEARKAGQLQHRFELSALGALILISGENSFLYIKRIFGNRVTRFLSDISFNTYIWHQVLAVKLKEWKIPNYISDTPQSAGEMPWQLHYTITCFFLAIILAILLTYLFDSPITKKLTKICIRRP